MNALLRSDKTVDLGVVLALLFSYVGCRAGFWPFQTHCLVSKSKVFTSVTNKGHQKPSNRGAGISNRGGGLK